MKKIVKATLFTLVFLFLSGCGGAVWTNGPTTYPFGEAYIDSLEYGSNYNFSLSGTVSGFPISGAGTEINTELMGPAVFLGMACLQQTSNTTGSYTSHGVITPFNEATISCYDSNYELLGTIGSSFFIVTDSAPIPDSVIIGDGGMFYSGETYSDSTFRVRTGRRTATISILADTIPNSALVNLSIVDYALNGVVTSSTTKLFHLYTDGFLSPISSSTISGAKTVITRYQ